MQILGRITWEELTPWDTETEIETKTTYKVIEFDDAGWIYRSKIGYHQLMLLGSVMNFQIL